MAGNVVVGERLERGRRDVHAKDDLDDKVQRRATTTQPRYHHWPDYKYVPTERSNGRAQLSRTLY